MLQHASQSARGNILFVDDEENITRTLERQFKPLGYNVFVANNGVAALHILVNDQIDVVVSDMRMPEMNGANLLKEVALKWPDVGRILLTGFAEVDAAIAAINEGKIDCYLEKPWNENYLESVIKNAVENKHLKDKTKLLQKEVYRQNQELLTLNHSLESTVTARTNELNKTLESLHRNQLATLNVCSNLIENQLPHYRGHAKKVADLARQIALKHKLSQTEASLIYYAGCLYALGKIAIPKQILNTPYRILRGEERNVFHQYPVIGATALLSNEHNDFEWVAEIVLAHREAFNGKGYPHKRAGEDIPIGARILYVAIDYEQLQSGMLLPDKLTNFQAIELIKASKGILYDPKVVDTFCEIIAMLPAESIKTTREKMLPPESLKAGMKLSRALLSSTGMLLLPEGTVLDDRAIHNLVNLKNIVAYIQIED
ncbi:HD domain-containing phosphohydrolase [Candidatus Berkiella aquae]|uniref:Response regulator n=1 Tax=Candidatus Berkiella aquae TaxID=295108 RepID=A0A0Q9YW52_9GAMM|nr:HD domain-containing phosphohydrolase [Candidatus Berkiella aquae]MCS5710357.1 response regulator [Candidatus Berkiella aquae]